MNDEALRRQTILEEEMIRLAARSKNKPVAFLLTFFFPFFGLLYSTNYGWAFFALVIDVINFLLVAALGLGVLTGLFWRLLALVIADSGIDRHRRRKLEALERDLPSAQPLPRRGLQGVVTDETGRRILPRNYP